MHLGFEFSQQSLKQSKLTTNMITTLPDPPWPSAQGKAESYLGLPGGQVRSGARISDRSGAPRGLCA